MYRTGVRVRELLETGRGGGTGRYLARNDECDGLDGARGKLVRAGDLAFGCADRAPRDETHPALRVARLMFVQRVQVIILVFKVSDITVALPSCTKG
jgi:hypothetical protein